jgi:hypothetical protein
MTLNLAMRHPQDEAKAMDRLLLRRAQLQQKKADLEKKIRDLGSLPADAFEKYRDTALPGLHRSLQKVQGQLKKFGCGLSVGPVRKGWEERGGGQIYGTQEAIEGVCVQACLSAWQGRKRGQQGRHTHLVPGLEACNHYYYCYHDYYCCWYHYYYYYYFIIVIMLESLLLLLLAVVLLLRKR